MTPRFAALFWRQVVRSAWRHPLLTALNVSSIALGVAVFLAIQLANHAALESFREAAALTSGKADLEVRGDIPEELFPKVRAMAGVKSATPLVEGIVLLPGAQGEYLRIVGADPLTGRDFLSFTLAQEQGEMDLEAWLGDSEGLAVQGTYLETLRPLLKDGQVEVMAGNTRRMLRPRFFLKPDSVLTQVDPRLAAMDIGWAQELLGRAGHLSSIQILLEDRGQLTAMRDHIQEMMPGDVVVAPPASRSTEMESMMGAFQLNLTAMSLVSIFVGMLLIYNSVSAAVVRRRTEIAILRAVGATRLEVRLLFLTEAMVEALIGAALGIVIAPLMAAIVATPIEQSLSTLYEIVRVGNLGLTGDQIAQAFTLGLAAALAAAWGPASEAAKSDPARIIHPGAALEQLSGLKVRHLAAACVLLAAAWGASAFALEGGPRWMGFASAAALLGGFSLMVPWLAAGVGAGFRRSSVLLRLAGNHFIRALHRNSTTIASLAAAVALTIGVTVMIHSFRASVGHWAERTLIADLYIAPAGNDIAGFQIELPPDAVEWLRRQAEVREISAFREAPTRLNGEPVTLTVIEGKGRGDLDFMEGSQPDAKEVFAKGEAAAISESLATRFHLQTGSMLELPTRNGKISLPVCGVFRDFSSDRGVIMMQESLYRKHWPDRGWHSLGITLDRPESVGVVAGRFREAFGKDGQFVIYDNDSLKRRVYEIFDRTFSVTSVLRGIAVLVAIIGVLFSLSVLVLEREREIGVLRSQGASRPQVLGIFIWEAGLIGLTACLSGLASGGFLAMVLTWVVNKAFFGWSIQLTYPFWPLALIPVWLIPAALVAAFLPAWRAAQIAPARAVRFE